MRSGTIIVVLAAVAGMAGFLLGGWLSMKPSDTLREGMRYEDMQLPDLEGRSRSLSEFDGKVRLVNFWATWCPPCVRELPMLGQLQYRLRDRGLVIIGISDEPAEQVRPFVKRYAAEFLHLLDHSGTNPSQRYGNLRSVLPYTVLIDAQGEIVWRHSGMLVEQDLLQRLEPLLQSP